MCLQGRYEKGEGLMDEISSLMLEPDGMDDTKRKQLSDAIYTLTESGELEENIDVNMALKLWAIVEAVTKHIGMPEKYIL